MTMGPSGSNPATMKECFLNPKWYPGKQSDSSQGARVLIGHLNVWTQRATRGFAQRERERNQQLQNGAQRALKVQGVSDLT